jgi:hypothetical protein
MQNARSAEVKSFIAKPQRMSLTKAHCPSYATDPKGLGLVAEK